MPFISVSSTGIILLAIGLKRGSWLSSQSQLHSWWKPFTRGRYCTRSVSYSKIALIMEFRIHPRPATSTLRPNYRPTLPYHKIDPGISCLPSIYPSISTSCFLAYIQPEIHISFKQRDLHSRKLCFTGIA